MTSYDTFGYLLILVYSSLRRNVYVGVMML